MPRPRPSRAAPPATAARTIPHQPVAGPVPAVGPRAAAWFQQPRNLGLLIAVVTLAAFSPLFVADFTLWDDLTTIAHNPRLNPPSWANLRHLWNPRNPVMDIYVPFTYTVWSAVATAAYVKDGDTLGIHLNPWLFHGTNVLLHVASALAAFALLRRLLRGAARAAPAAAAGALLYALHPVQVEPVGWTSGTKDVLFGLFALLAVWQYVEYADWPAAAAAATRPAGVAPPDRRWAHYAAGVICFALSMLAKPTGIVVPLAAGAVGVLLLRRPWRAVARDLLPWVLLSIPIVVEGRFAQPVANPDHPPTPLHLRPLIATDALAFYLYKLVWPAHLTITYDRAPRTVLRHGWAYATWVAPAAVAALAWACRRRARWVTAAVALYWIGVAPVLGLVPFDFQFVSTVGDHYLYFSMIGPALALAYALAGPPGRDGAAADDRTRPRAVDPLRRDWSRPVGWACAAVLAGLGVRSAVQATHWRDSIALFEHAVDVNPNSTPAWSNLAEMYTQNLRWTDAVHAYERAVAAEPGLAYDRVNLAIALARVDRLPEAEEQVRTALSISPRHETGRKVLATIIEARAMAAATRPTTTTAPATAPAPAPTATAPATPGTAPAAGAPAVK